MIAVNWVRLQEIFQARSVLYMLSTCMLLDQETGTSLYIVHVLVASPEMSPFVIMYWMPGVRRSIWSMKVTASELMTKQVCSRFTAHLLMSHDDAFLVTLRTTLLHLDGKERRASHTFFSSLHNTDRPERQRPTLQTSTYGPQNPVSSSSTRAKCHSALIRHQC